MVLQITEHQGNSPKWKTQSSKIWQSRDSLLGCLDNKMVLTWYRHFKGKWWVKSDFTACQPSFPRSNSKRKKYIL